MSSKKKKQTDGDADRPLSDEIKEQKAILRHKKDRRLANQLLKERARTELIVDALAEAITPVRFRPTRRKITSGSGDPEQAVLIISDCQIGRVTPSYNSQVFAERLRYLVEKTIKITGIQRQDHPVDEILVILNGDIPDGEGIFPTQAHHVDQAVLNQIYRTGLPAFVDALIALADNFKQVRVVATRGNHGRTGKFAKETSNWDIVFAESLKLALANVPNIAWNIVDDEFYTVEEVLGWKFFITHGHQVRAWMNIPFYGLIQRMMRWRGSIGEFRYMITGHFHTIGTFEWNDGVLYANGTFLSDDDYAKEQLGMSSSLAQWLLFVHEKVGVSAQHTIRFK